MGAHNDIQNRLHNIRKFSRAVKIATEVEGEKNKNKSSKESVINIETATTKSQETITLKNEIARLCTVVQEQSVFYKLKTGDSIEVSQVHPITKFTTAGCWIQKIRMN